MSDVSLFLVCITGIGIGHSLAAIMFFAWLTAEWIEESKEYG